MKLYHGTSVKIQDDFLKPHNPFPNASDYTSKVYMSDNFLIALLYSVNPMKEYFKKSNFKGHIHTFSKHFNIYDRTCPKLLEIYPGMFDEIFHRDAYIYVHEYKGERKNDTHEYPFDTDIEINEVIYIADVWEKLLQFAVQNELQIIYYEEYEEKYFDYRKSDFDNLYENCSDFERKFFHEKLNYFNK